MYNGIRSRDLAGQLLCSNWEKNIQQMTNAVHELFLGHLNNMFSSFINWHLGTNN